MAGARREGLGEELDDDEGEEAAAGEALQGERRNAKTVLSD